MNSDLTASDLDAYFARIGYHGPRDPTRATLDAISLAHVSRIPFENVDVLLGRPSAGAGPIIDLAVPAIVDKLVTRRRGGYCFEHNTLLLAVLTALGFDAHAISARVRIHRPRDFTPPRTHVFVHVVIEGEPWLADVGVGGLSLTSALRLVCDVEQATPHEPRRILVDGDWGAPASEWLRGPRARLFHQALLPDGWQDVCEFTLEPMHEIDRELGNWFTSTHPRSHFRDRLMVARATADGRLAILDDSFTERRHDGSSQTRRIASPEELLAILAERFALALPADTRFPHLEARWG